MIKFLFFFIIKSYTIFNKMDQNSLKYIYIYISIYHFFNDLILKEIIMIIFLYNFEFN